MARLFKGGKGTASALLTALLIGYGAENVGAQPVYSNGEYRAGERIGSAKESFILNSVLSAFTTGMSSKLNKHWFWRGFKAGLIGGGIESLSREYFVRHPDAFWKTKLMHSVGVSIKVNAVGNRGMFSDYQIPIGPAYLEVGKNGVHLIPSFSTSVSALFAIARGDDFSLRESLKTGSLAFVTPHSGQGFGVGNTLDLRDDPLSAKDGSALDYHERLTLRSHEFVHLLQQHSTGVMWTALTYPAIQRQAKEDGGWFGGMEEVHWAFRPFMYLFMPLGLGLAEAGPFYLPYGVVGFNDRMYNHVNPFEAEARRPEVTAFKNAMKAARK